MMGIRLSLHKENLTMCYYEAFYTMVKDWTVSDYRTPKIKAEVIVDMLISEFIDY